MIESAKDFLLDKWGGWKPEVGVVLGSGIQLSGSEFKELDRCPCADIPGLPQPSVEGHSGEWIRFDYQGVPLLLLGGRVHLYEGHSVESVTMGMKILGALGCEKVILTNAAGGINPAWSPGEVVMITSHLDFQRHGMISPSGSGSVFDEGWQGRIRDRVERLGTRQLAEGTYAALQGPTYETPAEVQMLQKLGADLVGMSTIQEARQARSLGMGAVAFSLVTNAAAGTGDSEVLDHEEVLQTGKASGGRVLEIVKEAIACSGDF